MKQTEIKELSIEELGQRLKAVKKEYEDLKMAHSVTPLENPMQLRQLRRTAARLSTELIKRDNA